MTGSLRKALVEGIRQTNRSLAVVWILFGVNFLLALIPALLFRSGIIAGFGSSLAPEQLISRFDFTVYMDLMYKNSGSLSGAFALITWFVIVNNLLSTFLDGGIIGTLGETSERFTFPSFFSLCGRFAGRFIRLFLVLILAIVAVGMVAMMVSGAVYSLVAGEGETEIEILRAAASAITVFILPMSMLALSADYARVITVAVDQRSMFKAFWLGVRFTFTHLIKTYGLYLILMIPALVLLLSWILISIGLNTSTIWAVLGVFLLQQVVVMARLWVKVVSVGSQVAFYASLKPVMVFEPQPVPLLVKPSLATELSSLEPETIIPSKEKKSLSNAPAMKKRRTPTARTTRKRVVPKTKEVFVKKRVTKKKK